MCKLKPVGRKELKNTFLEERKLFYPNDYIMTMAFDSY